MNIIKVEQGQKLNEVAKACFEPVYVVLSDPERLCKLLERSHERTVKHREDMIEACLIAKQVYEKYIAEVEKNLKN